MMPLIPALRLAKAHDGTKTGTVDVDRMILPRGSHEVEHKMDALTQGTIGGVVGGVAFLLILAGFVVFLVQRRKQKKARQRESALATLHTPPPAYYGINDSNSSSTACLPPRKPSPSLPPPPPPALCSQHLISRDVEEGGQGQHCEQEREQPPAYPETQQTQTQSMMPVYDPSRYQPQQIQQQGRPQQPQLRPTSNLTINSGYLQYLSSDAAHGQAQRASASQLSLPFAYQQQRRQTLQMQTQQGNGVSLPVMLESRPFSWVGSAQENLSVMPSPSRSPGPIPGSASGSGSGSRSASGSSTPQQVRRQPTRKAKPVLAKLITNFG